MVRSVLGQNQQQNSEDCSSLSVGVSELLENVMDAWHSGDPQIQSTNLGTGVKITSQAPTDR